MAWTDLLTVTNQLIGLIVLVISAGTGLIIWLYRRVRSIAKEANPIDLDTARRVQLIETKLGEVEGQVDGLDDRIIHVEKRLETVATQKDVSEIKQQVAGMDATLKMVSGMVDTIYRAAVSGADK